MQIPLVAERLKLFGNGFLPATVAAPLGEKERAAAFAEVHPLAWIDICPPVIASNPAPEIVFGKRCVTKHGYMLRVVHRGCMTNASTWSRVAADFVQHGQLALLKQAFPTYFDGLPTGLRTNTRSALPMKTTLIVPMPANTGAAWNGIRKTSFGKEHWFCFLMFGALTCEEFMFAHPIADPDGFDSVTDAPYCVGGSGLHGQPFTQVTHIQHYKNYTTECSLVAANVHIFSYNKLPIFLPLSLQLDEVGVQVTIVASSWPACQIFEAGTGANLRPKNPFRIFSASLCRRHAPFSLWLPWLAGSQVRQGCCCSHARLHCT